jgi:hypothetical protein
MDDGTAFRARQPSDRVHHVEGGAGSRGYIRH